MAIIFDDTESIRVELVKMRGARIGCPRRTTEGFAMADCWCYCSGYNGATLPCPPMPTDPWPKDDPAPEPFHMPAQTAVPWFPREA